MKFTIIALTLLIAGVQTLSFLFDDSRFLSEVVTSTTFNTNLMCGQCVRANYTYCFKTGSAKCCNTQACIDADKTMSCSNKVKSQFNRLYQFCGKTQATTCGPQQINLD